MSQAYVLNGVVVSDDGITVRYRTRCPRCGNINIWSIYSCGCREGTILNREPVPCTICSNMDKRTYSFEVQIRRGI